MLFGAAASPAWAMGTKGKGSAQCGPENEKEQLLLSTPPPPEHPPRGKPYGWLSCFPSTASYLHGVLGGWQRSKRRARITRLAAFNVVPFSVRIVTPALLSEAGHSQHSLPGAPCASLKIQCLQSVFSTDGASGLLLPFLTAGVDLLPFPVIGT